jgi:hypothetical protein
VAFVCIVLVGALALTEHHKARFQGSRVPVQVSVRTESNVVHVLCARDVGGESTIRRWRWNAALCRDREHGPGKLSHHRLCLSALTLRPSSSAPRQRPVSPRRAALGNLR